MKKTHLPKGVRLHIFEKQVYKYSKIGKAGHIAIILFLMCFSIQIYAQNCTLNAGINQTFCGNATTFELSGSATGLLVDPPTWSQIGGPSAIIEEPTNLNSQVSGLIGGNDYTFRLSATCSDGSSQFQDVTITVAPITMADAGLDLASCPDSSGSLIVNANNPSNVGEVGEWTIEGSNDAGVTVNFPNSPSTTISLADTNAGTTTLRWTIRGPDYAPGEFCESFSEIIITNYGGEALVDAGADQNLDQCYTVSQSTSLDASFGGNDINGQQGTWSLVSGPNTPVFGNANHNESNISDLIEGTYVLRWSVTGPCVNGSDTTTITVATPTQDITEATVVQRSIRYCDPTITTATLEGGVPEFAGETVSWVQTSGPSGAVILDDDNSTTQVTGLNGSSTYRFLYTITNNNTGCDDTAEVIVRYTNTTISIVANGGDDILAECGVTEVSIPFTTTGNGGNSYSIISGPAGSTVVDAGTFQNANSPLNIDFDLEGTYTVLLRKSVSGAVQTGCSEATDAINVTISLNPTPANAGTGQTLDCDITSTSVTGNLVEVGTSLWTQISGPSTTVIASPYERTTDVSNLIPGVYVLRYGVTGGNSCTPLTASDVQITVASSDPIVADAGAAQSICFGTPTTMAANTAATENLLGTWSVANAPLGSVITFADVNDPNTMVSGLDDPNETYELRWTIENPSNNVCPAPGSDTVLITTDSSAGPTIANAGANQCFPSGTTTVNLDANIPAGDENGLWSVSPDNGGVIFSDDTMYNTTATVLTEGSYLLTWTITKNSPGCQPSSDEVEITISGAAVADAGPDQEACSNVFTMAATSSTGTGLWTLVSGTGGFTIDDETSATAQFTFTYSGVYVFAWTVESGSCSTDTDEVQLNVGIPPSIATAGADQTICNANDVVLDGGAFDSNTENGVWTLLTGAPNTPNITDVNNPVTNVTGLVSGSYTFRWTITGGVACPPTFDDVVVDVFVPADAGSDQQLCEANNVLLEATFGSTGTWTQIAGPGVTTAGAAATISQTPTNSSVAEVVIIPGNTYEFQFTTDYTACPVTSDTVTIISSSGPPIDPFAGVDQLVCIADGTSVTLAGNDPIASGFDTTQPENSAFWRFAETPIGSVATFNDTNQYDTTLDNLTVPGVYILEWNFATEFCTDAADVVRIEVFEAPSDAEAGDDQTDACQLDAQLNATPPTVGIGEWTITTDPSGGAVVIDSPNLPASTLSNITTLGTYVFTWTVSNGTSFANPSGCAPKTDNVSVTFTDIPPSEAEAGTDQLFCDAIQTNLDAVPLAEGTGTWSQTAGPGITDPGSSATITAPNNPKALILDLGPGTYEFTWTSSNGGCSFEDTMEVEIQSQPLTADAGSDQNVEEFSPIVLAAVTPVTGVGLWTQVSGPTTANFIDAADPGTTVAGLTIGAYVFEWTVSNGICDDVSDTVEINIIGIADLELSKSVSPSSVSAGDIVTFTIAILNNDVSGSSDATGISVLDVVPLGYSLIPGTVSNGGVYNPGNLSVVWSDIAVPNGATINVTFQATVSANGPYENTAEIIASDQFDPDSTVNNNIASEDDQDTDTVTLETADLSLVKSVSPTAVSVGQEVTFTIEINNAGTDAATGVTVTDLVPAGYSLRTINNGGVANANQLSWSGLTIANGATTSVSFTATVNTPTGATDEYKNTAQITASDLADSDSTPNNDDGDQSEDDEDAASVFLENADLELSKSASATSGNVDDQITFTLSVFNNGAVETGDATGLQLIDHLPTGFSLVPGSVSNGGVYNAGNLTITWNDLSVQNGDTLDLTYDVTLNGFGTYQNVAEITATDLNDPDSTPNNDDGDQSEDDEASETIRLGTADLSIDKGISAISSSTPNAGDTVVFEIEIANTGPDNATNVTLADRVPAGYTLGTINNGGTFGGGLVSWDIVNLPVGTTTVSYQVTVNEPTGLPNEFTNIAEILFTDQFDPDSTPGNDDGDQDEDDEDSFTVNAQQIDLEVVKSISDETPNVGDTVIFTIAISNTGTAAATGVSVQDVLPVGFGSVSAISDAGSINGTAIDWNGLAVPLGSNTQVLTFSAVVLAPSGATDEYKNIVQITAADQSDVDSTVNNDDGDQSEDDEANVVAIPQEADLSISKTADVTSPNVGDTVTFTVTVSNAGPSIASGVSVTDVLPSGYVLTTVNEGGTLSGNTASWAGLGILANNSTITLSYEATVAAPTAATNEYLNRVQITASDQFDPDSDPLTDHTIDEDGDSDGDDDDETALLITPLLADLSLTKIVVDNDITPQVGTEISFEVTVFNSGPNDANDVVVRDLLPDGLDFVLFSSTSGIYNETTGIWQVGDVRSGGNETLVIDVLVNASGNYTNVAEVVASGVYDSDSTPNNNILAEDDQAEVTVNPVNVIDLSLTKTVNNATPDVTAEVTFTLTVENEGPSDATGIVVRDLLPSGYSYSSDTGGGAYAPITGLWTIGNLAGSTATTISIVANVNTTGSYENNAEIIAHNELDVDSTPNNNILAEDDQQQVTVTPRALVDLSVTKTANTLTPNVGGEIVFTITVTNDGPSDATNVVVTDLLTSGYEFISALQSTGVYEPLNGSWTVGNLDNGITENIVITAQVLANGDYINIAELTDLTEFDIDSEPANNDDTEDDQMTINPSPGLIADLSLTKTVDNASPFVGEEVRFTINLTNDGPSDASGVEVQDLLPAGYTYSSSTTTAGNYNAVSGLWQLNGILFNSTTETLVITAVVNESGPYDNTAQVWASNTNDPDAFAGNNVPSEDDQDSANTVPVPLADVSLNKQVDSTTPDVGSNVVFSLIVNNDGPSDATGVIVTDLLPAGYTYVSDDGQGSYDSVTGIWAVGTVPLLTTNTLNITASINASGNYTNSAEVTAVNEVDPDSTPNNGDINEDDQSERATTPRIITDISVEQTVDDLNPSIGDEITFTIVVTNNGPSDATALVIEDKLPSGFAFLSANTTVGSYDAVIGSWDISSLPEGASETLTITVEVLANGDYANIAELISLATFDPDSTPDNNLNSEDDQDTVIPSPNGSADLSLTKTVNNDMPNVGEEIVFTINISNEGDSDATGVVVTDLLPAGFTYESHIVTAGVYDQVTGIWNTNGTILNGTIETLIVRAKVNEPSGAENEYLNKAEITASAVADPDSDPNSSFEEDDFSDGLDDDDEASVLVVPPVVDIALTKTVNNQTPRIGQEIIFEITATNLSEATATTIGIEEIIPQGYELANTIETHGVYDAITGFWSIPSLGPSEMATLTLSVLVLDVNDYLNTASLVFVDQVDLNMANDRAEATVTPSCLNIYSEFSPNGDGSNEFFKIDCISKFPSNTLKIFNRWGNLVFEATGYANDWEGISNGRAVVNKSEKLPSGTYFYVLDLGDGSKPIADWLYINR